ncbi:MAG: TROVE domain-containing protein [bacterium]|nr:TROVE domain-containing protein [bacterium]
MKNQTALVNWEGAPTYHRTLREQAVQILTTGTGGDTFYASGKQLLTEAKEVLLRMRQECVEFLPRALVFAREEGFMRTLPTLGLVALSGGRASTKALFEKVFDRIILTPRDLSQFVMFARSGEIRGRDGLGGYALKAVKMWLADLSEYHALKYGAILRDVIRLSHPKPESAEVAERFGWILGGGKALGANPMLNPRIRAYEALKLASSEEEVIALIKQGNLPYEAVLPAVKATTPAIWSELLRQAPYMNLLKNLAAFTRQGVFVSEENVGYAVSKLTNPEAIRRSKVLPFRYFNAWRVYQGLEDFDPRIADALREALELSFQNMPSLGNRVVALGTDVSGSMSMGTISEKSSTRFIDIAGIYTGALLRRIEGRAIPLPFETCVRQNHGLSARDDIMVTAEKIARLGGGGTTVGAPVEYLLDRKIKVDAFIGITDQEDWCYGPGGSFRELWHRYRKIVAPEAKVYLVTIAPYRQAVVPAGEKGVRFIYGWSDRVLNYIALDLESGENQIRAIERMRLENARESTGSPEDDTEDARGSFV